MLTKDEARSDRSAPVAEALRECRPQFAFAAAFGVAINLLMLSGPLYMLQVYDRVLASGSVETLTALTVIVFAAYAALGAIDSARSALVSRAGLRLERLLGEKVMRAALSQPSCVGAEGVADLEKVRGFIGGSGAVAAMDLPFAPLFVVVITLLHPYLGALALASILVLSAIAYLSQRPIDARRRSAAPSMRLASASLSKPGAALTLGMAGALTQRWRDARYLDLRAERDQAEAETRFRSTAKAIRFGVQSCCLGLGALLVIHQELTAGAMIAASIILGRALAPIEQAIMIRSQYKAYRDALSALSETLTTHDAEGRFATPAILQSGALTLDRVAWAPTRGEPVVPELQISVPAGAMLGVIGPAGSGKTVIARLIAGALEPSRGVVRIGGYNRRHLDPEDLGRQVGFFENDPVFFQGSVAQNIARFSGAPIDLVVAAAESVGAHQTLQRLPEGYATEIGQAGCWLSSGQAQRVGLARAFFGDPKLLILDEPAAYLDENGKENLRRAVARRLDEGATAIWCSQSLRDLQRADFLLALTSGRQALFGPPASVLPRLTDASQSGSAPKSAIRSIAK